MQKEHYELLSRRIQGWQEQQAPEGVERIRAIGSAAAVEIGQLAAATETSRAHVPSEVGRLAAATDALERQIAALELRHLVDTAQTSASNLAGIIRINRRTAAYLHDMLRGVADAAESQAVDWNIVSDRLSHQVYQAKQLSALLQKLTEAGNTPARHPHNAAGAAPYSERDVEEIRRRAAAIRALGIVIGQALGLLPARYRRPRQCVLMRTVTGVVEVVSGNRQT
jgi:hypothetical protein